MNKYWILFGVAALAGCSSGNPLQRWNDYHVDMSYTGQLMKYACGHEPRCLEGYSKDYSPRNISPETGYVSSRRRQPKSVPAIYQVPQPSQTPPIVVSNSANQIEELKQKIEVLEDILSKNASNTNSNQELIKDQIVDLKKQISEARNDKDAQDRAAKSEAGINIP